MTAIFISILPRRFEQKFHDFYLDHKWEVGVVFLNVSDSMIKVIFQGEIG